MIIDIHAHLADYKLVPPYFLNGLIDESFLYYNKEINRNYIKNQLINSLKDFNCEKLLTQMFKANISKTVLLIADWGYIDQSFEVTLENIYRCYAKIISNNPNHFYVFSGVDPRRGIEGINLFEKSITTYGFKGLKLYPPCGFEIDDTLLYPFFEICEQYNLPILIHTGPSLNIMKTNFNMPESIIKMATRFKKAKFILGHAAILYYDTCAILPLKYNNIFIEVSGFQKMLKSKDEIKNKMKKLFDSVPDQILFGTDWPLYSFIGSQKRWVDFFIELNILNTNQLDKFFYQNAINILNN